MIETNFKHTDIGPIPHDWEVKRLGDIMDIKSGDSITGDSFLINGKFPVYGGNGIRGHVNQWNICGRYILIGRVGALCGNIHITSGKAFASEHALVCHPNCKYNADFLSPILRGMNLGQYSGASAQPVLAAGKLSKLQICFPPVEEQEAIGKALSDIDGLIDVLRKLIEKKRNIKQGAMSRLLSGSLRLPGFNKPWVTRTLGEIGHLIPNNSLSWEYLTNSGKVANIHYGHILTRFGAIVDVSYTQLPYVEKNSEARFLKGNMANDGDIIFADTAEDDTVGKAIELINIGDKHIVSGLHTFWFRPDVEFAHSFLGYAVNVEAFHSQIPLLATGTKVSSISKPNLLKLELHYPTDLAEQSAIAKVLTDMDAEIEGLEKKLAKYEQVKQGMMKQLLTGKIRLI